MLSPLRPSAWGGWALPEHTSKVGVRHMTAAVLSIGTELTRGELVNTNAAWLGEQLTELGFEVVEHATVDDDPSRIQESSSFS